MIKADLSYNPYLKETLIKFNGKAPRVNSLVEKYQDTMLQTWIDKVPKIFYDEMNGYDFELDFSGTKLDFEELKKAFIDAGVSSEEVRLFYINELDGRYIKVDKIMELLIWLKENPNRRLDYEKFQNDNGDLFEPTYTFIIIKGRDVDATVYDDTKVSVENIENVEELDNTELTDTPILFYLDAQNLKSLQKDLLYILRRKDIKPDQLFFLINPYLDRDMVERIISDLGVRFPNIVDNVNDEAIKKYLEIYSITDYISDSIYVFRNIIGEIKSVLDVQNKESMIKNKVIHDEIDQYEERIECLREADDKFFLRNNMDIPNTWLSSRDELYSIISNWRNRKTKTTKQEEAYFMADELARTANKAFESFKMEIQNLFYLFGSHIADRYRTWYEEGGVDSGFIPECSLNEKKMDIELPDFQMELMRIKEEEYVMPKDNLVGRFFKANADEEKKPILETTYQYQQWREYVVRVFNPIVTDIIKKYFEEIVEYADRLSDIYRVHIASLIGIENEKKEKTAMKLSGEEQKLQIDNDWIEAFENKVRVIERG